MELYGLQQGGYPFKSDDLPLSAWRDLGTLRAVLDSKRLYLG